MFIELSIPTHEREQFIDITPKLREVVAQSGVREGQLVAFVSHTTAGVTINENADPDVQHDLLTHLRRLFPADAGYRHAEGNSDAHLKTAFVGQSSTVLIHEGALMLGTWQSVYFCEFDGPRTRRLWVRVTGA